MSCEAEANDGIKNSELVAYDDAMGCCFPGKCCMPGDHLKSECHTAEMMEQVAPGPTDAEALAGIRRKLKLPETAQMFDGQPTIAGEMHVVCANARLFSAYIALGKCDDKSGLIIRMLDTLRKLTEISDRIPELNMSNYDSDDVAELNSGMCELAAFLDSELERHEDFVATIPPRAEGQN